MNIAITVDFSYKLYMNLNREGIYVHLKKLTAAMMECDKNLNIEIWYFKYNKKIIMKLFSEIILKYPLRVKLFDEFSIFPWNTIVTQFLRFINPLNILRLIKHGFLFIFLKRQNSKYRIDSLYKNSYRNDLIKAVKKYSKADVVFPSYILLPLALSFNCKIIMQIHDLFYLANKDIFILQIPKIDDINKDIQYMLSDYAKKGALFVSSSRYIRDNHVLKHIPGVKIEQTKIIPFPPMIKNIDFYTLPERESFLLKYNLSEKYIVFPSQIRPNKNVIAILNALLILKNKSINIQFVTTGVLSHFLPVLEFAKDNKLLNQIIETGHLTEEELTALYKYSTIVVCPNIIEGLGMSGQCLEALTVGNIPVVHAKSLGMKESLESVGLTFETADLNWFDIDDYSKLAENIEDVLKDPKPHIEKQKHILSYYTKRTWEDTAKDYLSII